jgi:hypothetical protein
MRDRDKRGRGIAQATATRYAATLRLARDEEARPDSSSEELLRSRRSNGGREHRGNPER